MGYAAKLGGGSTPVQDMQVRIKHQQPYATSGTRGGFLFYDFYNGTENIFVKLFKLLYITWTNEYGTTIPNDNNSVIYYANGGYINLVPNFNKELDFSNFMRIQVYCYSTQNAIHNFRASIYLNFHN